MWSFSRYFLGLPVALIAAAQPAAAAEFLFGTGSTSADLLANNTVYSSTASDSISVTLQETPTTASLDATLSIENVDAFVRADQRYLAADNNGYFGFERQAQLIHGPYVDDNSYDFVQSDVVGLFDFDAFYQATEDGFLRLTYEFASSGPAGEFDIMVGTDALGPMTYGFVFDGSPQAGHFDIPIVDGEEVVLTFGSSFSRSSGFALTSYSGLVSYQFLDAIPEPAAWAMMIAGFGLVGSMARSRRRALNV